MRRISIIFMNPEHSTLIPLRRIADKLGFRRLPIPDIAQGIETETGTFVDIKMADEVLTDYSRFREEREAAKNPLKKCDVLSFDVHDKPIGLGAYKTPVYEATRFKRDNTFDVQISVTDFPRHLSSADFVSDRYTIKGNVMDGPKEGELIEISCPKLAFINCIVGVDGKLGQESLTGYLHNRDVMTTLTKGEPIRITGCIQNDDGTYISSGSIGPVPFDASAVVQSSKFIPRNPKYEFSWNSLLLTVRFTTGPFVDTMQTVSLISRDEQNVPPGTQVDLNGVRVFHSGNMLASGFRPQNSTNG